MTSPPAKQLSVQSIRLAAMELRAWKKANDSQGVMHLVHLLAAKLAGAKPGVAIPYTETSVDLAFCDRFLRVNNSNNPYFDPLEMKHRFDGHHHSNVATARKKTFSDKWKAGEFSGEGDSTTFSLAADYASTLTGHMAKRGHYTKLSPAALACWLYREREFPFHFRVPDIVAEFREEFNFTDSEWDEIFAAVDDANSRQFDHWTPTRDRETSKTIIDVLTRDVDGFNLQRSLMAIREVCNVPLLTPQSIVEASKNLNCKQVVLQGPPGTGKTHIAKQVAKLLIEACLDDSRSNLGSSTDKGKWGIVQFHPSYGYEDFIQRLVPKQDEEGRVAVDPVNMPFLVACQLANEIAPNPFVLIVDEMNRADLQKVFGELMYALEYREEPVTLQYSREPLMVPENLYLIGTMNTADSSVVQVDYAIRRRFIFLDAPPDRQVIETVVTDERARKVAIALFEATLETCNNHPRFSIGHSYFLKNSVSGLIHSYVYQVLPVLRAYQDNGVIAEDATVHLRDWTSDPITPYQQRPDVLIESLAEWAEIL
jgi:5-methylcytosine-specific restriction protein B